MKELSDDELDGLFRKSFEEFDPPIETNDWNKLRERLDSAENIPVAGSWVKKYWPLAALLLIMIGGIGVYFGTEDGKVGEKRDTVLSVSDGPSSDQSAQKIDKPLLANSGQVVAEKPSSPYSDAQSGLDTESGDLRDEKQVRPDKDIRELPRNLASVSGVRERSNLAVNSDRGDGAVFLNTTKKTNSIKVSEEVPATTSDRNYNQSSGEQMFPTGIPESDVEEMEGLEVEDSKEISQFEPLVPLGFTATLPELPLRVVTDAIANGSGTDSLPPAKTNTPAWAIRIGVAPDLSTVSMQMKDFDRPGPSASLLVERSIARRWFVQTGVVRSLKTYRAMAGEYEWPANWYQSQMPMSVDGACRVIEVPINLRFDISQQERNNWFVGAGISSYKMQNEKYTYQYKNYDPNIRWWKWEGQTGWYLFSHLNTSVGYERRISDRLSMVVEPHLRVPLRKVGFGKVNLFTTGIWMSVRYTPVFRK